MEKNQKKKLIVFLVIGAVIELLVVILTGLFGMSPILGGLLSAIENYFAVWGQATVLAFICVGLYLFDIILFVLNVVFAIVKKKFLLIMHSLCLLLAIAFLPFLFLLTFPELEAGRVTVGGLYILATLMLLNILSIVLLARPIKCLYKCHKACQQPQEAEAVSNGLNEKQVRKIVEQYLEEHIEEDHKQEEAKPAPAPAPVEEPKEEPKEEKPAEEPVKEEPKKEEPVEEAEEEADEEDEDEGPVEDEIIQEGEVVDENEYEIIEMVDENGQKVRVKRRRKASFQTKLRNSEFDLRHKYYDLRDYIKWYGLSNRISIPGDSFSYKRRKLAFLTISGKRIKFFIALDPAKYEDSPIPVEKATAKKYADTPCLLKIKSDLSYRRAKKLVDEAMKEAGIEKPEGEEPKETQHPEEK